MNCLLKNAGYNILKTLASLIFPLASFSYASHILMADGMGKIEFSKSYAAYFTMFAMLGVVNYGTREGAKVKWDREKLSTLAQELLILNSCSALAAYGLLVLSIYMVPDIRSYEKLLWINSASILLSAAGMEWLYNAVEDYKFMAVRTCGFQALSLVLMVILVKGREDIWIYAVVQVIASFGSNVANLFHSSKYITYKRIGRYDFIRHIPSICLLFLMTLSIQVFTHMDSTMLGFIAGDKAVGFYSAASKMSNLASSMITSATFVFMPRIACLTAKEELGAIKGLCKDAFNYILLLGAPLSTGLFLTRRMVIELFCGAAFLQAEKTAGIMAARILLVPLNSFIAIHLFISMGKEKNTMVSTAGAAVLNLFLNLFLIPIFAQNGAAVGTVSAEALELVVNLMFLHRLAPVRELFKGTCQYGLAAGAVGSLAAFLNPRISSCGGLLLFWAAGATAYVCILLFYFKNDYILLMLRFLKK